MSEIQQFLCRVWLSFGNGHHFSKTRIQHKHDTIGCSGSH